MWHKAGYLTMMRPGYNLTFVPNTAYNCRLWLVFAIDGLWEIDQ